MWVLLPRVDRLRVALEARAKQRDDFAHITLDTMMNHTLASRPGHHTDRLSLCRGGWSSGNGWSSQGNTSRSLDLEST